ncbi:MAG: hypothetical protein FJ358_06875 [Thaumarchaeota archaeon]|nr:hypothetical protein [Nitrososphaerota archaeon]
MKPIIIIVVAVVAAIAGSVLLFLPSTTIIQPSDFRIEYARTGGIAGMDEKFVVEADGGASFTSNIRKQFTTKIDAIVFDDLKGFITRNIDRVPSTSIKAGPGAADYFEYTLTVRVNGKTYEFSWVDEGVAQTKIPEILNLIHSRVVIVQESLIK